MLQLNSIYGYFRNNFNFYVLFPIHFHSGKPCMLKSQARFRNKYILCHRIFDDTYFIDLIKNFLVKVRSFLTFKTSDALIKNLFF